MRVLVEELRTPLKVMFVAASRISKRLQPPSIRLGTSSSLPANKKSNWKMYSSKNKRERERGRDRETDREREGEREREKEREHLFRNTVDEK